MKLSIFPAPLPDEPIYSLVARYHDMLMYRTYRDTIRDLFGCESVAANVELPSRLEAFTERLPWDSLNVRNFIEQHTAAAYYAFIMPLDQRKRLIRALSGSSHPSPPAVIGGMARKVRPPRHLRFCSICVENDRKQYGNAYWHRVHQLPGVIVCPEHGCVLQKSNISNRSQRLRYAFISLEQALHDKKITLDTSEGFGILYITIAKDSLWMLNHWNDEPSLKNMRMALQSRMRLIDWMTAGGNLRAKTLREAWNGQYPYEYRSKLECGMDTLADPTFLTRSLLFGGRRTVHPLMAVLVTRLIGLTVEELSAQSSAKSTLEDSCAPRILCVNPVCPDMNTSRWMTKEESDKYPGRWVARCCCCGMAYTQDKHMLGKPYILERGKIWESRLVSLIDSNKLSLRKIAKQLGVDPMTVKKAALRLGVDTPWSKPVENKKVKRINKNLLSSQRSKWDQQREENKRASRTELRKLGPALWVWLKRNDNTWLEQNLPPQKPGHEGRKKIDWENRDQQLCLALEESVKEILTRTEHPIRITHTELARRVGKPDLFRKKLIKHFPKTKKVADRLTESRVQYAERRIKWCATQYVDEGKYPTRWELIRRAGLRDDMIVECAKVIDAELDKFGV